MPQEVTALSPGEEEAYRRWLRASQIRDADEADAFYDYRGLFKELKGRPVPMTPDRHFPDTYKQHGHPTFSIESKYSTGAGDGGRWEGESYVPQQAAYLSTDPNAGEYLSSDPNAGEPIQASPASAPAEEHVPGLGERLGTALHQAVAANNPIAVAQQTPDFLKGAYAGLMSTAYHGGDLIRRGLGMERIINQPESQQRMTPPQTDAGRAGFVAEQGTEWLRPTSAVTRSVAGLPWLVRMAAEGLTAAGVGGVQSGGDPGVMAASAVLPVAGSLALKGAGVVVRGAQRAAAGAQEGGLPGAIAGAIRAAVPTDAKSMIVQAIKPRAVKTAFSGEILERALPDIKAAESTLGKPIEGIDDLLAATKAAKQANRAQYAQLQGPQHAMGAEVNLSSVADAIEDSIPKRARLANDPKVDRTLDLARAYRDGTFKLEDAEQLLREANADLEAYYAKFPAARAKAAAANPETAGMLAEAKALRTAIYDTLDAPGQGEAARELQKRYGALMEVEDAAYRRYNVARRQQPESLSEQIGKVRAAADLARGTWRLLHLDLSGAADIAAAKAGSATAKYLKDQQTTDALIRRSFAGFKGTPAPIEMPPPVRIAGQLPPANTRLGAAPDPSYARAVDARPDMGIPLREGVIVDEPPVQPRGLLTESTRVPAPAKVRPMPGTVQPDPSYAKAVPAEYAKSEWDEFRSVSSQRGAGVWGDTFQGGHESSVFPQVLKDARANGYTGKTADLRRQFRAAMKDAQEIQRGFGGETSDESRALLRAIAKYGGISLKQEARAGRGAMGGETRWYLEGKAGREKAGTWGGQAGVFREGAGRVKKGTVDTSRLGKTWDQMRELIASDPRFAHLKLGTLREFEEAVRAAGQASSGGTGVSLGDALKRAGVSPGQKWWAATDFDPSAF